MSPTALFHANWLAALCLLGSAAHAAPLPDDQQFASANIHFAFNLLKEIAHEQPAADIFISPYSAAAALQMVANGAGGQTRLELRRALGLSALAPDAANAAYRDCDRALATQASNVVFTAANAIWYQQGTPVKPTFLSCNQQFFGATVEGLDFKDPRSVEFIDAWASDHTHGRIRGIAHGLVDPSTELFLANAVYFKGKWQDPFDARLTTQRPFHLRGGRQKQLPMMEQTRTFIYRRGSGYQAARLPYQGWSLAMYIFLPDPDSSPQKLLSIMSGDTWEHVTQPGFSQRPGTVILPKFELEYGINLGRPLTALGIRTAFDADKADFSAMSGRALFISGASQRTFVKVDEEGTEAAAVTALSVPPSGIEPEPPKPFRMVVDRPFLFLIENQETRTILFMGVLFDPAEPRPSPPGGK